MRRLFLLLLAVLLLAASAEGTDICAPDCTPEGNSSCRFAFNAPAYSALGTSSSMLRYYRLEDWGWKLIATAPGGCNWYPYGCSLWIDAAYTCPWYYCASFFFDGAFGIYVSPSADLCKYPSASVSNVPPKDYDAIFPCWNVSEWFVDGPNHLGFAQKSGCIEPPPVCPAGCDKAAKKFAGGWGSAGK